MKKSRKIAFSATLAIAYIISVVGFASLNIINTDIIAYEAIASYNSPRTATPKADISPILELSRQLISQVSGQELEPSRVLGDVTPAVLTQEQISDISNPAVVRVFNYVTGSITIPEFNVNINSLQLVPLSQTYTERVEELSTGTGFLVDDYGHILTNAHVVDEKIAMDIFTLKVVEYYGAVIKDMTNAMSPDELASLEAVLQGRYGDPSLEAAELLAVDMLKFITEFLDNNAQADLSQQVTVLNPSTTSGKINSRSDLTDLVQSSLATKVIDITADYKDSQKDVALIKISENDTPSLKINDTATVSSGQRIYVVGFPSNASVDRSDLYSTTITTGSVNSVKELNGITVYQTDAKISPGSSGGPVLNENGQVIGMMTFLTSGQVGDSFAFAIPIKFAQDMLRKNNVSNENTRFANNFLHGMNLKSEKMCRKANESFGAIGNMNALFNNKIQIKKYIDECNLTISAGQSMDGTWENFKETIAKVPPFAWAGGIGIILIVLASIYFIRKHKQLEQPMVMVSTISSNSV